MANTLWVKRNHAAQTSTVFKTPLPEADPNYPVTNLRDPDRYVVTVYPVGGAFDAIYYLDIGVNRTTHVAGLLGLTQGNGLFPQSWYLRRGAVFPEDGSWADVVSGQGLDQNQRDDLYTLPAPVTSRYWKFTLPGASFGYSLGKFLLGETLDLGVSFSPGSSETLIRQRVGNQTVMGVNFKTTTGPDRRRFSLLFAAVPGTLKDNLVAMATAAPFVFIHPTFGLCEADLVDDSLTVANRFGDVWDITLEVEQLP